VNLSRTDWTALEAKIVAWVRLLPNRNSKVHPTRGVEFDMVSLDLSNPPCDFTEEEEARLRQAPHLIIGLNPDGKTGTVEACTSPAAQEAEWLRMEPKTTCFVQPHSTTYISLDNRLFALQRTPLSPDLATLLREADIAFLRDEDSVAEQLATQIEVACQERKIPISR